MSSYNEIAKIKYEQESSDPVTLSEYVLFGDERAQKKVIVFKFENNVNQQLLGMSFEVSQYDKDDALIEKSVVVYTKYLAKANETFVPKAKLPVDYDCAKISVKLLKAAFDRFIWDEGRYVDNSYKFAHYVHDEELIEGRKAVAAAAEAPEPRKAPRPRVYAFSTRNVMRKNIAKFPAVFNWLICIIIVASIAVSLYFYRTRSNHLTLKDYDLKVINETQVSVCGYYGDYEKDGTLTIPEKIGDYLVVSVAEGAFKYNRKLTEVVFQSSVIVETGAFVNCKNLMDVSASDNATVIVKAKAFRGCGNIETIIMAGASLERNAFFGSYGVTAMAIGSYTNGISYYRQFFGADDETKLSRPLQFSCEKSIPIDFFEGTE